MTPRILLPLACLLLLASAQSPPNGGFKLNWKKGEYLDYRATLERSALSAPDKAALQRAIVEILGPPFGSQTAGELESMAAQTPVRIVDVTGDGIPEAIAQGAGGPERGCSPTGNCLFRVFTKTPTGYSPILKTIAQTFFVERRPGAKFYDIVIGMHGSSTETTYRLFRFTGEKYLEIACWDANWRQDDDGRIARNPVFTRCPVN